MHAPARTSSTEPSSIFSNRKLGWIFVGVFMFLWLITYSSMRCPTPALGNLDGPVEIREMDTSREEPSTPTPFRQDTISDEEPEKPSRPAPPPPKPMEKVDPVVEERRLAVKEAFMHAWNGYKKYAWGYDELRPTSNSGMDWLGLGATIVDALDTLWIMDLKEDFQLARDWVAEKLNFNKGDVSFFETSIRVLGGLGAAYDLSGDEMFLKKELEIGERLSWAFNTSSGVPFATINLSNHGGSSPGWTGGSSILAEVGTIQLEFKHLAHHTGYYYFYEKVEHVTDLLVQKHRGKKGLYGLYINPHSGDFSSDQTSFGALGDSFYEYLMKQYLYESKTEPKYRRLYDETVKAVDEVLIKKSKPSGLTYIAEWNGNGAVDKMDELACFVGGMFALGSRDAATPSQQARELQLGEELTETCFQMWKRSRTGIAPEMVYFREGSDFVPGVSYYILRPETIESLFILWRTTKNPKWREHGWEIFQAINKHCRTSSGFAGLRDVNQVPPDRDDQQQSFFFAETLKYLYLLFTPDDVIPLDEYVFNTEAHPLRIIEPNWKKN